MYNSGVFKVMECTTVRSSGILRTFRVAKMTAMSLAVSSSSILKNFRDASPLNNGDKKSREWTAVGSSGIPPTRRLAKLTAMSLTVSKRRAFRDASLWNNGDTARRRRRGNGQQGILRDSWHLQSCENDGTDPLGPAVCPPVGAPLALRHLTLLGRAGVSTHTHVAAAGCMPVLHLVAPDCYVPLRGDISD